MRCKISIRAIVLGLLISMATASAHELQSNRATLTMRDTNHVAMTLYLGYPELLHRTLAPLQSFAEFVLMYSSLPPEAFKPALVKAHAQWQSQIRVANLAGGVVQLDQCVWPDAKQAQEVLRQRAMKLLAAPDSHGDETPVEARCAVQTVKPISSLSVRFPTEFQGVLVVSYQPRQVWAEANGKPALVRF